MQRVCSCRNPTRPAPPESRLALDQSSVPQAHDTPRPCANDTRHEGPEPGEGASCHQRCTLSPYRLPPGHGGEAYPCEYEILPSPRSEGGWDAYRLSAEFGK